MINDQNHKTAIAKEWAIVKTLCRSSHRQYALPGAFINETPPAGFRNLPLVLGYAVLDEVLSILISQGSFTCKSWMLGAKMQAAEKVLPWQNYALVKAGKDARNGLAHQAKLVDDRQCLVFIEAIEAELKAWGVI